MRNIFRSAEKRSATLMVRDLMTTPAVAVKEEDSVATLCDVMDAQHVRHVPVVDEEGDLVGLVSHRDLLRSTLVGQPDVPVTVQRAVLGRTKVDEIMTHDVTTVEVDQDIGVAADLMLENKFGCLPVVEGSRLVGILTEADFVRFVGQKF